MRHNCCFKPGFILLATLTLLVLSGCGILSSDSGTEIHIKTDLEQYSISDDQLISVEMMNNSQQSIFTLSLRNVNLEMLMGGKWEDLGQWYLTPGIPAQFVEVKPGVEISPATPKLTSANDFLPETGLYRFKFSLYASKSNTEEFSYADNLLPLNDRVSNTIKIVD